jgi:hypothetical protein
MYLESNARWLSTKIIGKMYLKHIRGVLKIIIYIIKLVISVSLVMSISKLFYMCPLVTIQRKVRKCKADRIIEGKYF